MAFQPIVPFGGFAGWQFLQRTLDKQTTAFTDSAPVQRATDNFREKIGSITSAEQLMEDRALLQVALGAFGLDDDINSKAFIQQILEDGASTEGGLPSRLSDKRYAAMATAFGFDGIIPRTQLSTFADEIIDRYETRQFQKAVGDSNNDMRLALNLDAELTDLVAAQTSTDAQWFGVMGSPPLRNVFQTALGFPASFGRVDIDQQLTAYKDRAESTFGTDSVEDLLDPENQEKLIRLFLVRSEINAFSASSAGSVALTLLQSATITYN